jgi:hypothetical protein
MASDLQSCPKCGAKAEPGHKFCGRCGAVLDPGTGITGTEQSPQSVPADPSPSPAVTTGPVSTPPVTTSMVPPRSRLLIAGLAVILLLGAIGAFILLTGTGLPSAAGTVNQSASTGESYVVVGTEEPGPATPAPTILPATFVDTAITTRPPTPEITESVFCSSDLVQCNGTCVSLKTDHNNCGLCGTSCAIYQSCSNGVCRQTCSSGRTSCQDGCFDLMTSVNHCGDCLNSCPTGMYCYYGQCMGKGV